VIREVVAASLIAASVMASAASAYPRSWLKAAACIRWHESRNRWHLRDGAYQIIPSTWRSVGGSGYAGRASPAEQTFRAHRIWRRDGGSWREWTTAAACGLR
jgi:hypothetical protein